MGAANSSKYGHAFRFSFHLLQFMAKFTFEQYLSFTLLFKVAKKLHGKFSCSYYKAFFIFQITETGSHFVFNACAFTCIN